ncbi:MAG: TerB N-terminal domain-containing protein [Eubacteriales bacterium]
MADIKKLIEIILSDVKIKNLSSSSRVYSDEKIIRPSSALPNYIPDKIRQMKKIAAERDVYTRSDAYCFCRQAKFMEDYEDDYEYNGVFVQYFPTYNMMSTAQLRGYFSWRTELRRGNIKHTSLSFAFVYIYELINGIGWTDAEEGFHMLEDFWLSYREFDTSLDRYMKDWILDFAAYYGVDASLVSKYADEEFTNALIYLSSPEKYDDEKLYSAICALSSYNAGHSKFFTEYPDDAKAVVCAVFRNVSEYFEKHRKRGLCEKLFGEISSSIIYRMFSSAVFYDEKKYTDYEYPVNSIHKYRCKNRTWYLEKHYGKSEKSTELGSIVKMTDCIMRKKYGYRHLIKPCTVTNIVLSSIEKETDRYIEEKKRKAAPKIDIDMSKLGIIRRAADITRDKLIVPEEEENDVLILCTPAVEPPKKEEDAPPISKASVKTEEKQKAEAFPEGLNETEYELLRYLLYGGDIKTLMKEKNAIISVVADAANEKLFDMFSDTVIFFDGERPYIEEDYKEELKGIIPE